MTASGSSRLHRVVRVTGAIAVMAAVAAWWPAPRLSAQTATPAFELTGSGASEMQPLINALAPKFFEGTRVLSLSYYARGDRDGRATMARGEATYAISGRPLTQEDRDALAARKVGVIEAPFALTSMAFLLSAPKTLQGGDRSTRIRSRPSSSTRTTRTPPSSPTT